MRGRPLVGLSLPGVGRLAVDDALLPLVARIRAAQGRRIAVEPLPAGFHQSPGPLDRLVRTLPVAGDRPVLRTGLSVQPGLPRGEPLLAVVGLALPLVSDALPLIGLTLPLVGDSVR